MALGFLLLERFRSTVYRKHAAVHAIRVTIRLPSSLPFCETFEDALGLPEVG